LGADQPFLGVPGTDGAALPVPYRLEDYAADQLQVIRRIQPEGPYCLGGWSASAALSYEVAQQLRAQGQEVSLLVLFDGMNPGGFQQLALPERVENRIAKIAARVRFHRSNLKRDGAGYIRTFMRDRWIWLNFLSRRKFWVFSYRAHIHLGRRLPRWLQYPGDVLIQCFYEYQPKPYPGRVLLFRHGGRPANAAEDQLLGWKGLLTGSVEVCEVFGNHRGIFREPNVRVMADKLSESLLDVQLSGETDLRQAVARL